jgi:hypothetical protein
MDELKHLLNQKRIRSFKDYKSTYNHLEVRNEINYTNVPNHKTINRYKCRICNLVIENNCYTLQCGHKFHFDCAIHKHDEIIKDNPIVRRESFHSDHSYNMTEDKNLFCFICNEKDQNIYHKNNELNNSFYLMEEIHELIEYTDIFNFSADCLVFFINLWFTYALYFLIIKVLCPSLYYAILEGIVRLLSLT